MLPALTDLNRDWFTRGELTLQECAACGVVQHPPEEVCHACGSTSFTTRVVAPTGTVHSYTIVHHAVHPALADVGAVRRGAGGARRRCPTCAWSATCSTCPSTRSRIGLAVHATFPERVADDGEVLRLPQWVRRRAQG